MIFCIPCSLAAQSTGQLQFSIPQNYGPDHIALGASRYLYIKDNVDILGQDGVDFGMVGSTGVIRTEIGNGADVGDTYSNDHVWIHNNASIHGDIFSPNPTETQDINTITIDGTKKIGEVAINEFSWDFDIPDVVHDGIFLGSNQSLDDPLVPGRYSTLQLHPQTSVTLKSGTYVFDAFQIETGATIYLDDTDGAIFIYVIADSNYWMRGSMNPVNGDYARVMLAYTGAQDLFFEKRFVGTIVAPNAKVVVRGADEPHKGAVFAKDIEVDANAVLEHVPFGWLISEVIVGPEEPCLGEPTTIWVDTFSNDVTVNIDGSEGSYRTMSFYGSAFEREVFVMVEDANGTFETRLVKVPAKECDLKLYPIISATYDPVVDSYKMSVINSNLFSPNATYHWLFGTGVEYQNANSELYYNYAEFIDHEQLFTTFDVFVEVVEFGEVVAEGATTVKIMSDFSFDKSHHIFRPFVSAVESNLPMHKEYYLLEYKIENPDNDEAVAFTDALFEFVPCDVEKNSSVSETSVSIVVDPQSSYSSFLTLENDEVPDGTCNIVLRFVGYSSDSMRAYGNTVFRFESELRDEVSIVDDEAREFILVAVQNGWGEERWRISQEELLRWNMNGMYIPASLIPGTVESQQTIVGFNDLSHEEFPFFGPDVLLDEQTMLAMNTPVNSLPNFLASMIMAASDVPVSPVEIELGDNCDPMEDSMIIWNTQKYVCTPRLDANNQIDVVRDGNPAIINARKGDALLSRACSFVGDMLDVLGHDYSHTGIMTKNGVEVTHSILEIDRLMDNMEGELKTRGFNEDVLKYGLPGVISQSVESAYWPISKKMCNSANWQLCNCEKDHSNDSWQNDAFDDCYISSSFNANDVACTGTDSIKPLVVKPIPEFDNDVRSKLIAAADYAKTVRSHYRFYTYVKGALYDDLNSVAPVLSKWPAGEGTQPSSCAVFVMNALKHGGFDLEYSLIAKQSAENMVEKLHNGIKNKGLKELGKQEDYVVAGVPLAIAYEAAKVGGPIAGTAALFGSSFLIPGLVNKGAEHAANQIANCFVSDNCSDSYDNRTSDAWNNVKEAKTVSPGHLIADVNGGGWPTAEVGGPYGYFERVVFTQSYYSVKHHWQLASKPIEVKINVVDDCGNPLEDAEVSLVAMPGETINTEEDGVAVFSDVELGMTLDNKLHLNRRSVEVVVNYNGAPTNAVISDSLDNNQLEGTVVVDLSKVNPRRTPSIKFRENLQT